MDVIPYPAAKSLSADVLAAEGGVFIGCCKEGGKLVPKLSPEKLVGYSPTGVYFGTSIQPSGRLIVCNEEGFHYSITGNGFVKSNSGVVAKQPFAFNPDGGKSCLVGDTEVLMTAMTSSTKSAFNGNIFGGVFKNGRLFGVDRDDKYVIRWSEVGGLDFEEKPDGAGWLEITADKGEILGLVTYKQLIVAVCRYGLVVFSAFGMPENFKLRYIDGVTGEIYKNCAAVAGGKLVFFTEFGAYTFDGANVEKFNLPLFDDAESPVCALGFGEEYYLGAYSKSLGRAVVFVADVRKGVGYIVDAEASALLVSGKVHCVSDKGHFVFKEGGEYVYESGEFDFGERRDKVLKSVWLGSLEEVEVTVESRGKSRIFGGVKGYLRPHMRGKSFKITVRGRCEITGLRAEAEVWNGI